MDINEEPILKLSYPDGPSIIFGNPNKVTEWRTKTLFTKEPETIKWIVGFEPKSVFIDVGANVGMYSIWAALASKSIVYSFEPESQNYMMLNKNIFYNELSESVYAFPIALSNKVWQLGNLGLSQNLLGGSGHQFGETTIFNQGCVSTTLDVALKCLGVENPNHIKIDVDGLEPKVLEGAEATLAKPSMKSLLVETDTNNKIHMSMFEFLKKLKYTWSEEQIEEVVVKEGNFAGYANVIFTKE